MLQLTNEELTKRQLTNIVFERVPDVVEYKIPDRRDVLPFIRCKMCGSNTFAQSELIRDKLDELQASIFEKSRADTGVSRGMTHSEYSDAVSMLLDEMDSSQDKGGATFYKKFSRPCCRSEIIEQMIVPLNVPSYVERYIPGEGDLVGNVKVRFLTEESARIPYNPYTFTVSSLQLSEQGLSNASSESSDEDDAIQEENTELDTIEEDVPQLDLYPSMPPISDDFEEEVVEEYKTSEMVVGLVTTGIAGYESVLVRGRTIRAW